MSVELTAAGVMVRPPVEGSWMSVGSIAAGGISCRGDFDVCEKLTTVGAISRRGDFDVCEIDSSWWDLLSRRLRCV